jgi:hypothetical protein
MTNYISVEYGIEFYVKRPSTTLYELLIEQKIEHFIERLLIFIKVVELNKIISALGFVEWYICIFKRYRNGGRN